MTKFLVVFERQRFSDGANWTDSKIVEMQSLTEGEIKKLVDKETERWSDVGWIDVPVILSITKLEDE